MISSGNKFGPPKMLSEQDGLSKVSEQSPCLISTTKNLNELCMLSF